MSILCGKDSFDISRISYVAVETISDYELGELEEHYHGDYPGSVNSLLRESRRLRSSIYLYSSTSKSKLGEKFEDALNKYWYEIGLALPHPKSKNQTRDNWTFATKKQSTFSLGYISEDGDASVKWNFKKDYGTNAADYHVFGDSETTLSLADDVMPVIRLLAQKKPQEKSKTQKTGEFLSFLFELAVHPADAIYHDDSRDTPEEMQTELKALLKEYEDTYGKIRKEKTNNEARMKKREEFLKKYADKSVLILSVDGERRKYLEDYCGFDIFAKKQEIEKELELYQGKRNARIKSEKATLIAKITSEFYEQNLLSATSLSNSEKLKAYSDIRDFCCKYIPVLAERGFRVESLHSDYSDYVSEEVCTAFKENWIRLSRSHSVLSRGASGEEKVYEVLRLFDDRIRILRDYVWGHEHDFIVITPYGISTIEVKNLRGDYVLTETGVLKCISSDKVKPKDVALQSKKHLETLRRNLNGCAAFSSNVPLQEIICSAESNFTIRDDYHYIPVCYYNTVDKALFPENTKPILNEKAMDAIEKYLLENRREAFKFDVFLPRGEIDSRADFIKCFADVASGYMTAQITQQ